MMSKKSSIFKRIYARDSSRPLEPPVQEALRVFAVAGRLDQMLNRGFRFGFCSWSRIALAIRSESTVESPQIVKLNYLTIKIT